MVTLVRRLLKSAVAYQASSVVASLLALLTIPLYTKYLPAGGYGYAESLLTAIILASIVLRFGIGEALVRYWFDDADPVRRRALAKTATGWTLTLTTVASALALLFAGPIGRALLNLDDRVLVACGVLGLFAFTNLEVAYALLRVQEARRVYVVTSLANVLLTVGLTVTFVVGLRWGARGYVLGNYLASAIVLGGLWFHQRHYLGWRPRGFRALLAYAAPTVPADAAIFALNVIDRSYILHAKSPAYADRYALAAKLSTVVIVAVRGFQSAWPPLAYSIDDDADARALYARVTTAYVAATGTVVAALALVGPWFVRLLAADERFYDATRALPWVALGWALYGLVLVLITVGGRAKITSRNLPAALAGLVVNVVLLVLLVGPLDIAGAGIALAGAYVVMVVVLYVLTRDLFAVPFEWSRIAAAIAICTLVAVAGVLAAPDTGLGGFLVRGALAASVPVLIVVTGVLPRSVLDAILRRAR